MTELEIEKAFRRWCAIYKMEELELKLAPFLVAHMEPFAVGQDGWLKKVRESLFFSAQGVADRLNVSRTAFVKYEESETKGVISLMTLAKVAEAMDCELIYGIRPKNRKQISAIVWQKLFSAAIKHPWIKKCDQRRRVEALVSVTTGYMKSAKFRKQQGWSQRAHF